MRLAAIALALVLAAPVGAAGATDCRTVKEALVACDFQLTEATRELEAAQAEAVKLKQQIAAQDETPEPEPLPTWITAGIFGTLVFAAGVGLGIPLGLYFGK